MRRLTAALLIQFFLVLAALYTGSAIGDMTQACVSQLEQAQQFAKQDQWGQARSATSQAWQDWDSHSFSLYALMHHTELDQILLSFRAVEQYLSLEEMDEYAAANATLIAQLNLLAEMEQPSLENVL